MSAAPGVRVAIVTHDSAADLWGCLESLADLDGPAVEIVVVDCASRDDSVSIARRPPDGLVVDVVPLAENRGFAGGMNIAFGYRGAAPVAPWFLTLNADARPRPDFLQRLLERASTSAAWRPGAVTGRLLRPADEDGSRGLDTPTLDACGMRLTRTWRHLDRGSGEVDRGQFGEACRVFGGTGAATLWSRAALADVAVEGEVFAADFHSFREDAELCFRLQERGWQVLYEPRAVAEHRRSVLPARRSRLPAYINYHSLKNRYLLRAYHQDAGNLLRTLVPAVGRDLAALAYVLVRERHSLAAYRWLWRNRARIARRRRLLRARRTAPRASVERWFGVDEQPL